VRSVQGGVIPIFTSTTGYNNLITKALNGRCNEFQMGKQKHVPDATDEVATGKIDLR
jgi:hypothetical protein